MNLKVKGTILGIVSAVSYGTNPLGALFLYQEGLNSNSVLFYRFSLAAVVLACILFIQKQSFRLSRKEVKTLCLLGILFAVSSLTFYTSFHHMDAGIASTLLFVYPIMVAVIMSLFFKERISPVTMFSIILALSGIALLFPGRNRSRIKWFGRIVGYDCIVNLCPLYCRNQSVVDKTFIYKADFLCLAVLYGSHSLSFVFRRK